MNHPAVSSLLAPSKANLGISAQITSITQCISKLIFNALDAEATSVAVRLELNQFKLQVIDNGVGMTESQLNQLQISLNKPNAADQEQCGPNNCSQARTFTLLKEVCQSLMVISRNGDSDQTYFRVWKCSKAARKSEIAPQQRAVHGTTIIIEGLFYKQPIRQKLIRPVIELSRVKKQISIISLAHPRVSFSLRDNSTGTAVLQIKKNDTLLERFSCVYPEVANSSLVEVKASYKEIDITGIISRNPHHENSLQSVHINRRPIFNSFIHDLVNFCLSKSFFLNGIYFKNKISSANGGAVEELLKGFKFPGNKVQELAFPLGSPIFPNSKFAVYSIVITCPQSEYSIVPSPRSTEVIFSNQKAFIDCLQEAMQQFLHSESDLNRINDDVTRVAPTLTDPNADCEAPRVTSTRGRKDKPIIPVVDPPKPKAHKRKGTGVEVKSNELELSSSLGFPLLKHKAFTSKTRRKAQKLRSSAEKCKDFRQVTVNPSAFPPFSRSKRRKGAESVLTDLTVDNRQNFTNLKANQLQTSMGTDLMIIKRKKVKNRNCPSDENSLKPGMKCSAKTKSFPYQGSETVWSPCNSLQKPPKAAKEDKSIVSERKDTRHFVQVGNPKKKRTAENVLTGITSRGTSEDIRMIKGANSRKRKTNSESILTNLTLGSPESSTRPGKNLAKRTIPALKKSKKERHIDSTNDYKNCHEERGTALSLSSGRKSCATNVHVALSDQILESTNDFDCNASIEAVCASIGPVPVTTDLNVINPSRITDLENLLTDLESVSSENSAGKLSEMNFSTMLSRKNSLQLSSINLTSLRRKKSQKVGLYDANVRTSSRRKQSRNQQKKNRNLATCIKHRKFQSRSRKLLRTKTPHTSSKPPAEKIRGIFGFLKQDNQMRERNQELEKRPGILKGYRKVRRLQSPTQRESTLLNWNLQNPQKKNLKVSRNVPREGMKMLDKDRPPIIPYAKNLSKTLERELAPEKEGEESLHGVCFQANLRKTKEIGDSMIPPKNATRLKQKREVYKNLNLLNVNNQEIESYLLHSLVPPFESRESDLSFTKQRRKTSPVTRNCELNKSYKGICIGNEEVFKPVRSEHGPLQPSVSAPFEWPSDGEMFGTPVRNLSEKFEKIHLSREFQTASNNVDAYSALKTILNDGNSFVHSKMHAKPVQNPVLVTDSQPVISDVPSPFLRLPRTTKKCISVSDVFLSMRMESHCDESNFGSQYNPTPSVVEDNLISDYGGKALEQVYSNKKAVSPNCTENLEHVPSVDLNPLCTSFCSVSAAPHEFKPSTYCVDSPDGKSFQSMSSFQPLSFLDTTFETTRQQKFESTPNCAPDDFNFSPCSDFLNWDCSEQDRPANEPLISTYQGGIMCTHKTLTQSDSKMKRDCEFSPNPSEKFPRFGPQSKLGRVQHSQKLIPEDTQTIAQLIKPNAPNNTKLKFNVKDYESCQSLGQQDVFQTRNGSFCKKPKMLFNSLTTGNQWPEKESRVSEQSLITVKKFHPGDSRQRDHSVRYISLDLNLESKPNELHSNNNSRFHSERIHAQPSAPPRNFGSKDQKCGAVTEQKFSKDHPDSCSSAFGPRESSKTMNLVQSNTSFDNEQSLTYVDFQSPPNEPSNNTSEDKDVDDCCRGLEKMTMRDNYSTACEAVGPEHNGYDCKEAQDCHLKDERTSSVTWMVAETPSQSYRPAQWDNSHRVKVRKTPDDISNSGTYFFRNRRTPKLINATSILVHSSSGMSFILPSIQKTVLLPECDVDGPSRSLKSKNEEENFQIVEKRRGELNQEADEKTFWGLLSRLDAFTSKFGALKSKGFGILEKSHVEGVSSNFSLSTLPQSVTKGTNAKTVGTSAELFVFEKNLFHTLEVLGQMDCKFILTVVPVQCSRLVVAFDQHAVDERIRVEKLFNEYCVDFTSKVWKSVAVNPNLVVSVTAERAVLCGNFKSMFQKVGLFFSVNETNLTVSKVPLCLLKSSQRNNEALYDVILDLLNEMIKSIVDLNGVCPSIPNCMLLAVNEEACKRAVKFGNKLTYFQCKSLLEGLKTCQFPFQCAHGRPLLFPIADLNKLSP